MTAQLLQSENPFKTVNFSRSIMSFKVTFFFSFDDLSDLFKEILFQLARKMVN